MQNLTYASKAIFNEFSQTEREYRNKEARMQREIDRARMTTEDMRTEQRTHYTREAFMQRQLDSSNERIEELLADVVQEAAIHERDLEELEGNMAEETSKLERLCEERGNELQDADGIIEETYEQVREMIRLMKNRRSDMTDEVYTNMMRMLNTTHSVLLRR
jgi:hypothetical protein